MYELESVHFLVSFYWLSFQRLMQKYHVFVTLQVDEMVQNGFVVETNKQNILRPIALMERESQKADSMFR